MISGKFWDIPRQQVNLIMMFGSILKENKHNQILKI